MVVTNDIKAGVIWSGVVGSYREMLTSWRRRPPFPLPSAAVRWRERFIAEYGTPEENPTFWNEISPFSYVADASGPIQLHHGTVDDSVPIAFSESLKKRLEDARKTVEYYPYVGDDHNIANNFQTAIQRSIAFFDKYVKG